jgi:hypothetical protein
MNKSFIELAKEDPDRLISLIEGGTLRATEITYAAEALAVVKGSRAVDCLLKLLGNPSSLIREGAIYGLEGHLDQPNIRERLQEIARSDPKEGVREAASEALE